MAGTGWKMATEASKAKKAVRDAARALGYIATFMPKPYAHWTGNSLHVHVSVWDADGKRYIDYVGSWGPLILGHADPDVVKAVQDAATRGLSFGAPTELEVEFAERLVALYPSLEMLRCVSSGTEATHYAMRLARAYTGRDKILKFEGHFHGWQDYALSDGSDLLALGDMREPSHALGGLGMYSFGCSEDCDRETEFGFNVGGGLNFNLGTMDTFAEIRYHDAGDASFVPIVFGIRF